MLVLAVSISLCGCASESGWLPSNGTKEQSAKVDITQNETQQDTLTAGDSESRVDITQDETLGLYYHEQLNSEDKALYDEIYSLLVSRADDIRLSGMDTQKIDDIFLFVTMDHPELYSVTGYNLTKHSIGDTPMYYSMSGIFAMTKEEADSYIPTINAYTDSVDKYISSLYPEGCDDYELIKAVYEYIINNTEYDSSATNNQNIVSVMKDGRSVCQGYAKTFQYILNRYGIECALVSGTVLENQPHAWNVVKADNEYYQVDITWGDASYLIKQNDMLTDKTLPPISYNYLLVTTDEITKTHSIDSKLKLPQCISLSDNYYVREGVYFKEVDTDKLSQVFERAYKNGDETVTIKMSDSDAYSKMQKYLLREQKIFEYYRSSDQITYVEDPAANCMIFWILV